MGTWNMEHDRKRSIRAIQEALDLGVTHVDTAEMYGSGRVEELVGEAIAGRRDEVFLVTKVLATNGHYDDTLRACERSLTKLGTDVIDVYLLHWRGSIRLEETFRAFDRLAQDGKIRAYGVSNFDTADMEEAVAITGEGKIVCNQVLYHVLQRRIESSLIDWCHDHDVAVVSYSPFGQGRFPRPNSPEGKALAAVGERHGLSPYQVALQFLIRYRDTFAIPKTSSLEHLRDNASAMSVELSQVELDQLAAAFPAPSPGGLPML